MFEIKEIYFEGLHLRAIEPLAVSYEIEEDLFISKSRKLKISSFGESSTKAGENLLEKIAFMWEEYALVLDDELSKDAINIKEELLKNFKEV